MGQGDPVLLILIAASSFALAYLGAAVGLVLGHLRLPLLIHYLGSATLGAAANNLTSGAGALAGALRHLREGRVSRDCLILMGVPSVVGGALTAYLLTRQVAGLWASVAIGAMLVVSGLNLALGKKTPERGPGGRPNVVFEVGIGLLFGSLTALTGLMLGSLRLPMMIRVLRLDPRVAVGTNMVIGSATALVSSLTTLASMLLRNYEATPWAGFGWALLAVAPPTVLGGWLGGRLTGKISKESVTALAGWAIAVSGVTMIAFAAHGAAMSKTPGLPGMTEENTDDNDTDDD